RLADVVAALVTRPPDAAPATLPPAETVRAAVVALLVRVARGGSDDALSDLRGAVPLLAAAAAQLPDAPPSAAPLRAWLDDLYAPALATATTRQDAALERLLPLADGNAGDDAVAWVAAELPAVAAALLPILVDDDLARRTLAARLVAPLLRQHGRA